MARPTRKDKGNTLDAVAAAAGVSTMTVSRVLRGQSNVSEKTRARVMGAVDELGYVHNRLAGALATSRSGQIAVIVPSLRNIVFPEVLSGITDALEGTEFTAAVGITDYDLDREAELVRSMMAWRPAGLVIANVEHRDEVRRVLARSGIPVVELMELTTSPIDFCIGLDQRRAGATMARHLLDRGYRRFGYLGSDHALDRAAARRYEGFVQAVGEGGGAMTRTLTVAEPSGIGLGRDNAHPFVRGDAAVEALYCSNDSVAAGAMMHCLAEHVAVPGELAIASFSGLEIARAMPVPITTVRSPRYEMGKLSVARILERIAGGDPPKVTDAGFELVVGEST